MRLNQVAAGLTDLPVAVEYHTDWGIDDLSDAARQSLFPIVGVDLRYIEGVVIARVANELIVVHDPLYAQSPREIGLQAFAEAWEGADRECLTIALKR